MKIITSIIFLIFCFVNQTYTQNKPNILWITIEDTSPQFIGCYGNVNARTPTIDKLAKEGIRFTNSFSTGTVCSPSRSCIITGIKTYKTGTGNHRSNYPVPDYIKGFPFFLQKEGYYTSNNSKTDYNVANLSEFIKEAWDESSNTAGWQDRKPGQAFFAVYNFMDSHQSRTMTQPYSWYQTNVLDHLQESERIDENMFEMPPFYLDSPEMRKQFARVYNSLKLTDNKIGELLDRLENDHLKDSTIIFFFADHGEGEPRGKTNGINLGYQVPFIIWFPEMYKDLSPWGSGGVVSDELINFEDLAPSIISLAGGKVPDYLNGRILIGDKRSEPRDHIILSNDRSDNGIDLVRSVTDGKYMYSRNYMPFIPQARYIRYMEIGEIKQQMRNDLAAKKLNSLQKSLFEERPPEFLYDIENDIWETKNLAMDPAYNDILYKMRGELRTELIDARDVLLLPEYSIELISRNATPYEFRFSDKDFPIEEIYSAASLSGFRSKKVAAKQSELLKSQNSIIRYWAIIGLKSQHSEILTPYIEQIITAMDDPYPPVAITASAIAYQEFGNSDAMEKLIKMCSNSDQILALMTINYLLYIDNKEPFIQTIQSVHKLKSSTYNVKAACMDFLGILGLVPNDFKHRD